MDTLKQYLDLFSTAVGFLLGCGVTISVQRLRWVETPMSLISRIVPWVGSKLGMI